jgi:hypothetical protein
VNYKKIVLIISSLCLIFGGIIGVKKIRKPHFTNYSIEPNVCKAGESKPVLLYSNYSDGSVVKEDPSSYSILYQKDGDVAKKLKIEEMLDTVFINCYVAGSFPIQAEIAEVKGQKKTLIDSEIKVIPGEPSKILKVSGDEQESQTLQPFPKNVIVVVQDTWGNSVPNAEVRVEIKEDQADVEKSNYSSNDEGFVSIPIKAGKKKGHFSLTLFGKFSDKNVSENINFLVKSGEAKKLIFTEQPINEMEAGISLAKPIVVAISDEFNNPLDNELSGVELKAYHDNNCLIPIADNLTISKIKSKNGQVNFYGVKLNLASDVYFGASSGELKVCSDKVTITPSDAVSIFTKNKPSIESEAGSSLLVGPIFGFKDAYSNITNKIATKINITVFNDNACKIPAAGKLEMNQGTIENGNLNLSNIKYTKAGKIFLKLSSENLSDLCYGPINFLNSKADHLVLISGDHQSKVVNSSLDEIKVKVLDSFENPVPNFKVNFDYQSQFITSSISDENGIASAYLMLDKVKGQKQIKIYSKLLKSDSSFIELIASANASSSNKVSFNVQPPSEVKAGEILSISPKILILDKFNNVVDTANEDLKVAKYKDKECKQVIQEVNNLNLKSQNGLLEIKNISHQKAESIFLGVSSSSMSGTCSSEIKVLANSSSKLVINKEPISGIAGQPFDSVLDISVLDQYGNLSNYSGPINLILNAPDPITLNGVLSPIVSSGNVKISDLTINVSGDNYSITINGDKLIGAKTKEFKIKPAKASQLVFLSAAQIIPADQCSSINRIQTQDQYGNPSQLTYNDVFTLKGENTTFFSDSDCSNPILDLNFSEKSNGGSFYFSRKELGKFDIAISNKNLKSGIQSEEITQDIPVKLTLTGPKTMQSGNCSGPFLIRSLDRFGNSSPFSTDTSVNLLGTISGGFYSDLNCAHPISEIQIPMNNSQASFYLKDNFAESFTLKSEIANIVAGQLDVEIKELAPTKLIIKGPSSTDVDQCSSELKVSLQDKFGNDVKTDSDLILSPYLLDKATLYSDPDCLNFVSNLTISSGKNKQIFYYKSIKSGKNLIKLTATGMSDGSIEMYVVPSVASSLKLINQPAEVFSNHSMKLIQIGIYDNYNNLISTENKEIKIEAFTNADCSNPASGKLKTASFTNVDGTIQIKDLSYDQTDEIFLKFSSSGLDSLCSNSINVISPMLKKSSP